MEPYSEVRNRPRSRINSYKPSRISGDPSNVRETRFPRTSDIEKQTQELKALKLYAMNNQFRQLMFLGQQLTVQKCLSKYNFYSDAMEKINRKKLRIIKCGKGTMYLGEVFNDKCHGRGIVVFQDGRLYEGQLQNNVRQGEGLYVQPDGSWYFGEFSNDKKDGSGIQVHKSYKYKGAYINGLKHGVGFMVADNIVYSGEWRLGAIHGYGFAQTPDSRYEGTFDKFLKHGEGIQYFRNGDVYKGSYVNGKPEGQGYYTWSDKSSFQGQFKNGKRNGNGVWKSSSGDQYVGTYQMDVKHGQGQFNWKSGNVYKGNFAYDKREGYGEMYWRDGSYYKGFWSKGVQNGKGQLFVPPNKIHTGVFQNNVLVVEDHPKARPMTDKKSTKRRRMQIMSSAKPSNSTTYFHMDKQFYQTQKKRPPKQKQLSPLVHVMNYHHRNCPACFERAQRAAENFRIQRTTNSEMRNKSSSYYIPKPKPKYTHNHSFRESPDDSHSFQYPRGASRMQFSANIPGSIESQQHRKDGSPFKYLKFKFT